MARIYSRQYRKNITARMRRLDTLKRNVTKKFGAVFNAASPKVALAMASNLRSEKRIKNFARWIRTAPDDMQRIIAFHAAEHAKKQLVDAMKKRKGKALSTATQEIMDLRRKATPPEGYEHIALPNKNRTSGVPLIRQIFGRSKNRSLLSSITILKSGKKGFFVGIPGNVRHPGGMKAAALARMHEQGFSQGASSISDITAQDRRDVMFLAMQESQGTPREERVGNGHRIIKVPARPILGLVRKAMTGRQYVKAVMDLAKSPVLKYVMATGDFEKGAKGKTAKAVKSSNGKATPKQGQRLQRSKSVAKKILADMLKPKATKTTKKTVKKAGVKVAAKMLRMDSTKTGAWFFNQVQRKLWSFR